MAHFFNPANGVPISEIEVPKDGAKGISIWGGGPPPDYEYLTLKLTPGGFNGVGGSPFGDDLGNHNRLVSLTGNVIADGSVLHAYVTLGGNQTGSDYAHPVTVHVFPTIRLTPPPLRQQDQTRSECWAGGLSSWSVVAKGQRSKFSIKELTDKYGGSDGGIDENTLANKLSVDFDYKFDRKATLGPNNLLLTKLAAKLQKNGHVLMVYKSGMQSSHTLVVYGVGAQRAGKRGVMFCMDPWYGTYKEYTAEEFYDKPVFLAYPPG